MKRPPNQRQFKNPRHVARYPRSFLLGRNERARRGEAEGASEERETKGVDGDSDAGGESRISEARRR